MESGKSLCSSNGAKQDIDKIKIAKSNRNVMDKKGNQCCSVSRVKVKGFRPSMIPIMKNDNIDTKTYVCKKTRASSSKFLSSKAIRDRESLDYKLKVLKEKERSIAEYYFKIEEIIQKFMSQKRDDRPQKPSSSKAEDSSARKMTSDPSVFSRSRMKSEITDFENNIQQISNIWLKTTSDLSCVLKNLKSNSRVDPIELQMENIRIQLAIKQAKSLTLVKTRNVIAEAKKLFRNREIIRSELESLLNFEDLKTEPENKRKTLEEKNKTFKQENIEEQGINGNGDSLKDREAGDVEICNDIISEKSEKEDVVLQTENSIGEDNFLEKKDNILDEPRVKPDSAFNTAKIVLEVENLKKELSHKNKTITNLNKKIFELQKSCNENSAKYNQLQVKLFEFHEKIQWNEVLWKQITKLKEQIKGFQQNNRELEFQKKDLESKITKLEREIDRLLKLNHILNQRRHLLNAQEIKVTECRNAEHKQKQSQGEAPHEKCLKTAENKAEVDEKIILEKQNAINQLWKMLNAMKDQENFAKKQISMFQSRIEELEKNGKI